MIDIARTADPAIRKLLEGHPKVAEVADSDSPGIEFEQGGWKRAVLAGPPAVPGELYGLVELMDNNPLVCADRAYVPTPLGVLAAIALGPLLEAGILSEEPTLLSNLDDDLAAIEALLGRSVVLSVSERDLQGVVAATIMAAVTTPARIEDLNDLYEERFGRSFFVHREDTGNWDIALVKGTQNAYYRLRIAPDNPVSLLTIQAMADSNGKCGAGALVHAMNVMAGFEESLGLAGA